MPAGYDSSSGLTAFPIYLAEISPESPNVVYTDSKCFDSIEFNLSGDKISILTSGHTKEACNDMFLIANTEMMEVQKIKTDGTVEVTVPTVHDTVKLFEFCDNPLKTAVKGKRLVNMLKPYLDVKESRPPT